MTNYIVVYLIVVIVVTLLDLSPVFMDEPLQRLLYSDEVEEVPETSNTDGVFGDSTVTGVVSDSDLVDKDAEKIAAEMINEIYNGKV